MKDKSDDSKMLTVNDPSIWEKKIRLMKLACLGPFKHWKFCLIQEKKPHTETASQILEMAISHGTLGEVDLSDFSADGPLPIMDSVRQFLIEGSVWRKLAEITTINCVSNFYDQISFLALDHHLSEPETSLTCLPTSATHPIQSELVIRLFLLSQHIN